MQVLCDLGTDCSDCGSWTYLLPAEDQTVPEPIAQILKHGIEIYVNRTSTLPSFVMPFTDPKKDVDVSGQMHFNRNVEIGITQVGRALIVFLVIKTVCLLIKALCYNAAGVAPAAFRKLSASQWIQITHS